MTTESPGRRQRETLHLMEVALSAHHPPTARAVAVLILHQRRDAGSCLCGWSEIGQSHAAHQVAELTRAGLLPA